MKIDWKNIIEEVGGSNSKVVTLGALVSSASVIVLPYDPLNDRVLLVLQFRTGPYFNRHTNPWLLEPITRFIDIGETPEEAGLREAKEKAYLKFNTYETSCAQLSFT